MPGHHFSSSRFPCHSGPRFALKCRDGRTYIKLENKYRSNENRFMASPFCHLGVCCRLRAFLATHPCPPPLFLLGGMVWRSFDHKRPQLLLFWQQQGQFTCRRSGWKHPAGRIVQLSGIAPHVSWSKWHQFPAPGKFCRQGERGGNNSLDQIHRKKHIHSRSRFG